jgi:hypothetical protein
MASGKGTASNYIIFDSAAPAIVAFQSSNSSSQAAG